MNRAIASTAELYSFAKFYNYFVTWFLFRLAFYMFSPLLGGIPALIIACILDIIVQILAIIVGYKSRSLSSLIFAILWVVASYAVPFIVGLLIGLGYLSTDNAELTILLYTAVPGWTLLILFLITCNTVFKRNQVATGFFINLKLVKRMTYCPSCHQATPSYQKFCVNCGAPLGSDNDAPNDWSIEELIRRAADL